MEDYAFKDNDKMADIIKELKTIREKFTKCQYIKEEQSQKIVNLIEDLMGLVDLHPQHSTNVCILGGMPELIGLGSDFPDSNVRSSAM